MVYLNLHLVVRKFIIISEFKLQYIRRQPLGGIEEADKIKMHFMDLISEDGGFGISCSETSFSVPTK